MKMIKFDLPIDGVKVSTHDDLRDHFTTEIIGHYRSGLLAKWLRSRRMTEELAAVEALSAEDDAAALKGLCQIFKVKADDDVITAAIAEETREGGIKINADSIGNAMKEQIGLVTVIIDKAFRTFPITAPTGCIIGWYELSDNPLDYPKDSMEREWVTKKRSMYFEKIAELATAMTTTAKDALPIISEFKTNLELYASSLSALPAIPQPAEQTEKARQGIAEKCVAVDAVLIPIFEEAFRVLKKL